MSETVVSNDLKSYFYVSVFLSVQGMYIGVCEYHKGMSDPMPLKRWRDMSVIENLLFLQRTQVKFQAPMWQFRTVLPILSCLTFFSHFYVH